VSGQRQRPLEQVPRLALSVDEAAAAIGVSRDSLEREILHELRTVRVGRRRLVPVRELERWVERNAACVADELRRHV
jgi:excisionase family DNA binding protein